MRNASMVYCFTDRIAKLLCRDFEVERLSRIDQVQCDPSPAVIIADTEQLEPYDIHLLSALRQKGFSAIRFAPPSEDDLPSGFSQAFDGWVPHPHPKNAAVLAVRAGISASGQRLHTLSSSSATIDNERLREVVKVGTLLATVRDYETFFPTAISLACKMANADGGSIYLIETDADGNKSLRFKLAQSHSRPDIPFREMTFPLDNKSLAGHVAITGSPLVIDNSYEISKDGGVVINRSFDEQHNYKTISVINVPMRTHKDEILGVIQLINCKRNYDAVLTAADDFEKEVVPFGATTLELLTALGGQIGVCLENNRLYDDIEKLFEGFVTASVTAIEQRDPTTSGHSGRVAELTIGLATAVDAVSSGRFGGLNFTREQMRELRYASLLHDFGKVGVREEILVKPTKLQPYQLELVKKRHALILRTAERNHFIKRVEYLERNGVTGYEEFLRELQASFQDELAGLQRFLNVVIQSNIPTVLPEGNFSALADYGRMTFEDVDGSRSPFLTTDEVRFLSIHKGSLDDDERLQIESHVTNTFNFLEKIPWTKNLRDVPKIAYGHHEKLNGHGYPRRIDAPEIPIQTRMMTISDIFDALTASDRPYKKSLPAEKALDIISDEAREGLLDADLLDLFIGSKIYSLTQR